jgi:4-hydroxybenzoyl-CoA thioesterase
MLVNRKRILVEFADCDPAGIVFYANYFRWFDDCTTALFLAAGLPIRKLFKSHKVVGIPIVDAHARFLKPSSYGDELEVESRISEWRNSSFVISHTFYRNGELALEGFETRVWAAAHPSEEGRLKALPIPGDVIDKLTRQKKGRTKRG